MVVDGFLDANHLYRLHQIDEPVQVTLRPATVTEDGLNGIYDAAILYDRHSFLLSIKESGLEGFDKYFARITSLSNVRVYVAKDTDS